MCILENKPFNNKVFHLDCGEVYTEGGAEVPACRKGCMAYADAMTLRDFPSFEQDPIANLFSSMDNIFGSRPMQHLLGRRPERIERPRVLNSLWGRKDDDFFEPFEFKVVNGDGLFGRLHSQMSNMLQNMPIQVTLTVSKLFCVCSALFEFYVQEEFC